MTEGKLDVRALENAVGALVLALGGVVEDLRVVEGVSSSKDPDVAVADCKRRASGIWRGAMQLRLLLDPDGRDFKGRMAVEVMEDEAQG